MPVNTASITSVEPVAHGAVPRRIECCCTLKNRLLQQVMVLFEQHPYFVRRIALQDTGALAAAEYGRLAVWEHSPLFQGWAPHLSQLDGASAVLVLHLDR